MILGIFFWNKISVHTLHKLVVHRNFHVMYKKLCTLWIQFRAQPGHTKCVQIFFRTYMNDFGFLAYHCGCDSIHRCEHPNRYQTYCSLRSLTFFLDVFFFTPRCNNFLVTLEKRQTQLKSNFQNL